VPPVRVADPQALCQVGVDLDEPQISGACSEPIRQRSQAGADFHHPFLPAQPGELHNALCDPRLNEKMLPESLARPAAQTRELAPDRTSRRRGGVGPGHLPPGAGC
jgi:hypothetical protein